MSQPKCPRCLHVITSEDTLAFDGDRIFHLDCHRPRQLTHDERALLFKFCWDHDVAQCVTCDQSYRQYKLVADLNLFSPRIDLCPHCRADLTASMRSHLHTCGLVPSEVQRRAQDARDAVRELIKHSQQLADRSDVLTTENEALRAEVWTLLRQARTALAALRETVSAPRK